jgi:hypothetical protein
LPITKEHGVMLNRTTKKACLIDVAVSSTHKPYCKTTEKLQQYRSERKANKDMVAERGVYSTIGITNNGYY